MQSTASLAPPLGRYLPLVRPMLREHRLLVVMVAVYAVFSLAMNLTLGNRAETEKVSSLFWNFVTMLPAMGYFLLMWRFAHAARVVRPANRLEWLKADVRRALTDPERMVSGAIAFVLMVVVLVSFAQLKRLIPILQPFAWDEAMIAADRALHFGTDPWRIVHAAMGHPLIVTAVTGAYNFWLFLLYFVLIATCFSTANRAARMQYLVAFLLTWAIGGNLVATVFSSAGPVYVDRLGLGGTFVPLVQILEAHAATQPITVTEAQDILWRFYAAPQSLNGISAFPSMHVASSVLMAAYGFRLHRRLGQALAGFAAVIMLGSVLLGWHYAVDGYAGAVIALACWSLAGWLVARFWKTGPERAAA